MSRVSDANRKHSTISKLKFKRKNKKLNSMWKQTVGVDQKAPVTKLSPLPCKGFRPWRERRQKQEKKGGIEHEYRDK